METIRYIYRSGRIPEIASKIGAILPLKPILSVHGGKLHFAGATTSMEKSKEKILKLLKDTWDENFPEIGLMYIESSEELVKFKEKISNSLPKALILISEFSPILGYATGKGTLGIGFFAKD
jgi:fatty acid-binding protein DegV